MELTKQAISKNKRILPGIEGYLVPISKIEKNININPDISIESCKSLIEGLCKKALDLISTRYKVDKNFRNKCNDKMPLLIETAFKEVYKSDFEAKFYTSLNSLIDKYDNIERLKNRLERLVQNNSDDTRQKVEDVVIAISVLRNNRGDISHGRVYPKEKESEIHLAKSIISITDGICFFMIEKLAAQYLMKLQEQDKLIYESKEMDSYNEDLDRSLDFPIKKVRYSKLLFEYDYDEYKSRYYDEFLKSIEDESGSEAETLVEPAEVPEEKEVEVPVEAVTEIPKQPRAETVTPEEKAAGEVPVETVAETPKPQEAETTPPEEKTIETPPDKPAAETPSTEPERTPETEKIENLINTFNEKTFWTSEKDKALQSFSETEKLKSDELKKLINNFLFTEKEPLRNDVVKAMNDKPLLKDRASITTELTEKIMDLANTMNQPTKET